MSLFKNALGMLKEALKASRRFHTSSQPENRISLVGQAEQQKSIQDEGNDTRNLSDEPWENQMTTLQGGKKRKADGDDIVYARKKGRLGPDDDSDLCNALDASRIDDVSERGDLSWSEAKSDRELMPPPAMPLNRRSSLGATKRHKRDSFDTFEILSEGQTQGPRTSELDDEFDMESARRRAAAIQLPPNSGTWEAAEQELFFHLSYRGFEPLLQKNWMIDFPTLPLGLFATHQDQSPLIELHRSSEFRAIKALRDLIDTGKTVRDRVLSAHTELRSEPVIERAANKYIKWSLKDLGIARKQCIPVHAVAAMKPNQTTQDTIRELAIKMHRLSSRHREACDVLTSVERADEEENDLDQGETRLDEQKRDTEHDLPVIYGLMICSSLLAVFTLSSHTPPPAFVRRAQRDRSQHKHVVFDGNVNVEDTEMSDIDGDNNDDNNNDEDSGLRFIASFDFSDATSDVWNAFVIAIVAMMVRKSLLEIYDIPSIALDDHDFDESVLESSLIDDTIDASGDRYVARYAAGGRVEAGSVRVEPYDDDDPDR